MSVQIHYGGIVYNLDPDRADAFWIQHYDDVLRRLHSGDAPQPMGLNLESGSGVDLWVYPNTPIAIQATDPVSLFGDERR